MISALAAARLRSANSIPACGERNAPDARMQDKGKTGFFARHVSLLLGLR
jgi:hypothetical protein